MGVCFLAAVSSFSLRRLAYCCELMPLSAASATGSPFTYYKIGEVAAGRPGKYLAWFGLVAMTLGVCGAYIVFVASMNPEACQRIRVVRSSCAGQEGGGLRRRNGDTEGLLLPDP